MKTRGLHLLLVRAASVAAALAMMLSLPTAASAAGNSPFTGQWEATDTDGSQMKLIIAGPAQGPFQITWTDDYISLCQGEPGIIRGTGSLNPGDANLLEADVKAECLTTHQELDFHFDFRFHATANTLSLRYDASSVVVWTRPGRPQPPPPQFNLRANYGDNWVESFYEAGHTVWVTVTEADGVTIKAMLEAVTEPKWYWGDEPGFTSGDSGWLDADGNPMEGQPDIRINDWIFGWVDNGASAQIRIGEIMGEVDLVTNTVTGTVNAPWLTEQVSTECLDWGSGMETPYNTIQGSTISADGSDTYLCTWEEWDIQAWQTVGVGYFDASGNWVSRGFVAPTFGAYVPSAIEGYAWPLGKTISISINDGEYTAQAVSEQQPGGSETDTRVLFELWRDNVSMQPGDHIVMTDGVVTKDTYVSSLAVTSVDPAAHTVSGVFSPDYGNIWVWIYDGDGQIPAVQDNSWTATLEAAEPGATGGATQWEPDGDATSLDFQVQATYMITTAEDGLANDGQCTLREAIIAANTNSPSGDAHGECFGGLDEFTDIIRLLPGQTYSLTIDGTDEGAALDGDLDIWDNSADPDLVIEVAGEESATVSQDAAVDDRVFENRGGQVIMSRLTVTGGGNTGVGGGILNGGSLQLNSSEVTGNASGWVGGGIASFGGTSLTVDGSRITNNFSSSDGGGIMNWGSTTVTGSMISNNTTDHNGGGIANEGTLVVDASTIAANVASGGTGGGGGLSTGGTATIQNGTVIGGDPETGQGNPGGGIINFGELLVQDSQITGNSADFAPGIANWGGTVTVSHSTVSLNSATASAGGIHNKDGGTVTVQDGSLITGNTCTYDGGGINNWGGAVTVQNSTVSSNTAGRSGGGIYNLSDGTLVVEGSTISDNSADGGGGLSDWGGMVTLSRSTLEGNRAAWAGAIFTSGGTVTVDATTISRNTGQNDAGGIQMKDAAVVTVQNGSTISNNQAAWGAGIANWGSTLMVDASAVNGNEATQSAGGVLNKDGGTATIRNGSLVSGNSATWEGGISNWGGSYLIVDGSIISDNHAFRSNGGIGNLGAMVVTGSAFLNNTSDGNGDAIGSLTPEAGASVVHESCFVGNGSIAVYNYYMDPAFGQDFTGNWWGAPTGPGWEGPGLGDSVGPNIDFSGWLMEAPAICPGGG